jgi:hypothetical protein
MARLANPVPRRRRGRTNALGAPHAAPPLADPTPFQPYSAVFGPGGVVREPSDTVAEKLAPISPAPAAGATPPRHSGGTSGDLTVPGYTPETPTGAPYSPTEPGHSAADFAAAFRAKAAAERRHRALELLPSLKAPGAPAAPTAVQKLAQAAGGAIADPLQTLLTALPKPSLVSQVPEFKSELPSLPTFDIATELKHAAAPPAPVPVPQAQNPGVTIEQLYKRAGMHQEHGSWVGGDPTAFGASLKRFTPAQQAALLGGGAIGGTKAAPEQAPAGGGSAVLAAIRNGTADPKDPLGAKTLGNITEQQLVAASKAGTLHINKKGVLSVPATRSVLANLLAAHKELAASGGGGNSVEDQVGRFLLAHGLNRTGASGIIGNAVQESSLDPTAMEPGSHNGGLWGFTAEPNSLANLEEFASSRGQDWRDPKVQSAFLLEHVDPETVTALNRASTPEQAAEIFQNEFEHPLVSSENQPRREEGARTAFEGGWARPDPEAAQNLKTAQQAARKAGINPTPWNGDVAGGSGEYVTIRADAKGALNWAESAVGTKQGEPRQLHWAAITHGPEDPWCAEFTTAAMLRQGLPMPDEPAYAGTYLNWKGGTDLGADLSKAKPGDILVFGEPGGRSEHVGIYKGDGVMISGNFSDEVALSDVEDEVGAAGGLQGVVRPKYKGGKIKVKAGSLPGSSAGSLPSGTSSSSGSTGTLVSGETSSASAPGEPAVAGNTRAREQGQQALASFTPLAAPTLGVNSFAREPSEAEELLKLLTQASSRVNRA